MNSMEIPDQDDAEARISWRERQHFLARRVQRHPGYLFAKDAFRFTRQLLPNAFRLATHRRRCLPGVIIVGAQKAGTTQLYANLIRHPRCFGGVRKELHYFSKHHRWPHAWYQSRFPRRAQVERASGVCLEASPSYLPSPDALRRMHALAPTALVIAVLRDPVARAFSHYQHDKTRRRESRSFAETVADEISRNQGIIPNLRTTRSPDDRSLTNHVARGYYALQLETLMHFYPRNQVFIVDSADLFADTGAVCRQIFELLGLESIEIQSEKIYNRGYYRDTIEPATAERLREHYQPHDEMLVELLGRDFGWMRTSSAPVSRPTSSIGAIRAA